MLIFGPIFIHSFSVSRKDLMREGEVGNRNFGGRQEGESEWEVGVDGGMVNSQCWGGEEEHAGKSPAVKANPGTGYWAWYYTHLPSFHSLSCPVQRFSSPTLQIMETGAQRIQYLPTDS